MIVHLLSCDTQRSVYKTIVPCGIMCSDDHVGVRECIVW